MIVHKINIDAFEDLEYILIAIHSTLEDYRIAYYINKTLQTHLELYPNEIEIQMGSRFGCFTHYGYEDSENNVVWNLVPNKTHFSSNSEVEMSLFNELNTSFSSPICLLPELKTVDYILKIDEVDEIFDIDYIIERLNSLKFITTAYELQQDKIKSKNNLIF